MKISLVQMTTEHFSDWKDIVEQPDLTISKYNNLLDRLTSEQKQDRSYHYLIQDEKEGIIGGIGLFNVWRSEFRMALLDYTIKPSFRRRGAACQALSILEGRAYSDLHLKKLVGYVELENIASQKLLEKAGYKSTLDLNGLIDKDGTPRSCLVFVKILSIT